MVRMDFVLTNDHNVHLIEVNESPYFSARNGEPFMYHNVLRNLFNMLGIGTAYQYGHFHFK